MELIASVVVAVYQFLQNVRLVDSDHRGEETARRRCGPGVASRIVSSGGPTLADTRRHCRGPALLRHLADPQRDHRRERRGRLRTPPQGDQPLRYGRHRPTRPVPGCPPRGGDHLRRSACRHGRRQPARPPAREQPADGPPEVAADRRFHDDRNRQLRWSPPGDRAPHRPRPPTHLTRHRAARLARIAGSAAGLARCARRRKPTDRPRRGGHLVVRKRRGRIRADPCR
jgi:hypothetical protein